MYEYPVMFPTISNRESWSQTVQICDDDTGDLITLTDEAGAPLYAVTLEISPPQNCGGYRSPYSGAYYDTECDPTIMASLADYLTITGAGTIQIQIPYTVMQTLSRQTYNVYMRVEDTAAGDARQILIGGLPVAYGGRAS